MSCQFLGCTKPVWVGEGIAHHYCGRTHACEALNRKREQLQPPHGPCHRCQLPGCEEPVHFEEDTGRVHDFCCRTHAAQAELQGLAPRSMARAASRVRECSLPGCTKPCWVDERNIEHDFCGRSHAVEAKVQGSGHLVNVQRDSGFELVDTTVRCTAVVSELLQCRAVAVDLEGVDLCRTGKICLLQIACDHSRDGPQTYLFDVQTIGTQRAFQILSGLLQSPTVVKVMFDVRADSDALWHLHGIHLRNAYDVQVLFTFKFGEHRDHYLKSLKVVLDELYSSGGIPASEYEVGQRLKDAGKALFVRELGGDPRAWERRPLSRELLKYAGNLFELHGRNSVKQIKRLISGPSGSKLLDLILTGRGGLAWDVKYLLAMKGTWGGGACDEQVVMTTKQVSLLPPNETDAQATRSSGNRVNLMFCPFWISNARTVCARMAGCVQSWSDLGMVDPARGFGDRVEVAEQRSAQGEARLQHPLPLAHPGRGLLRSSGQFLELWTLRRCEAVCLCSC